MLNLLESVQVHNQLNPAIWEGDQLKPEVRLQLLKIVDEFKDYCNLDFNVIDARLVGSNASFNYTESSDLDLHLVVNFDFFNSEDEILQALFNFEKTSFNSNYDIKIKGIDVEVYVEDIHASTCSNGIFSIFKNKWIKYPKPIEIPYQDLSQQLSKAQEQILKCLNDCDNSKDVQMMIDSIYLLRKDGLESGGEYSVGNQLFKEIRNLGLIEQLKDKLNQLKSSELTLEGYIK